MGKNMKDIVMDPLSDNNPITVQMLGICSALAVTAQLTTAVIMSVAVTLVVAGSSTIISMMRNMIPPKIRMIVEMVVIATLVITVDQFLQAFFFEASKQLSVFVGLIITNCIVMGRAEAFARELIGAGTLFGLSVLPASYPGNGLMVIAPGAFIVIGLLIWLQRTLTGKYEEA